MRKLILVVSAALIATSLAACGDTWRGAKKDTGDNLQSTGQALERTGTRTKQ
jgi:predicted small secreted protein